MSDQGQTHAPEEPGTGAARLAALAAYVDIFESPAFTPGYWVKSEQNQAGVWSMPYVEHSAELQAFVSMCYSEQWIILGFEWMAWHQTEEAMALFRDSGQFESATSEQLARALTAIVRSDRFSEGSLMGASDRGLLVAICRRARALLDGGSA